MRSLPLSICVMLVNAALAARPTPAEEVTVTNIKAACRNGQTFVTWKDAAEGEAGSKYRYSLYRSDAPITQENLAKAELCYPGVVNNSCKRIGLAYDLKDRLDPKKPTYVLEEGKEPMPMWTGVAVRTVSKDGKSYYAVMVTDPKYAPAGKIVPGQSATTEAVEEKVAPIQPIRHFSGKDNTGISGKEGLPLMLSLHGSGSRGTNCPTRGDVYAYFGTPEMGWRDGLPGVFAVYEQQGKSLIIFPSDSIENPRGDRAIETCWFGYYCVPVGAEHKEPRAYPFTERRLEWMVKWTIARYKADPLRVTSQGQSMGGMGSTQWAWRRPDIFTAVYPRLTRVRQTWMPGCGLNVSSSIHLATWNKPAPMFDGQSDYFKDKMDSVKYAAEHHEDLAFYALAQGRNDYVNPWSYMVEMARNLTANHHGFALAWTNGGHSSEGAAGIRLINKYYPPSKFSLDRSYPAFGHSSINDNMGTGEFDDNKKLKDGDPVGGINLGFDWSDVADEDGNWSAKISNDLCKAEMTVDVTPRRCQKFKAKPGEKFKWTNSAGGAGEVAADQWGLVTVEKVKIKPGEATTLTISR